MWKRIWIAKIAAVLVVVFSGLICAGLTEPLESKLIKKLTSSQDPAAFPRRKYKEAINVTFSISLRRILQVNDRSHVIKTRMWVRQIWKNVFLTWNASEWGNVDAINFPATSVWLPDIVLYNSIDAEIFPGGTELYKTAVLGSPDGMQRWYAPVTLETSCTIDVRYFPFDEQTCAFNFGSWSNDVETIDVYPDSSESISKNFLEGAEWALVSSSAKRVVTKYDCCPNKFATVFFYITIKRKSMYYIVTLIVPCLMVLPLTVVSFFLPPDSGERIGLTITILLAMAVFLQLTSEILPKFSKNTPYLSLFFVSTMSVTTLSLFVTGFVLLLHFKGSSGGRSKMPSWMKKHLVQKLGNFLMVKEVRMIETCGNKEKPNSLLYQNGMIKCTTLDRAGENQEQDAKIKIISAVTSNTCDESTEQKSVKCHNMNTQLLQTILQHVAGFSSYLSELDKDESIANDWRLLAIVVDRLLLVSFTIISIVLSIVFLNPIYSR